MKNTKCNFRGIVGKDFDEKEIKNFGKQVVHYINSNKYSKEIIIGKDNRQTGDYILSLLESVLLARGISVYVIGVCTTPELLYLTKKFKFSLGVMITASHNSYEYNGFKCYDKLGELINIHEYEAKNYKRKDYGTIVNIGKYKELYLRELKNELNPNKIKCVFDCANGASLEVVRKLFPKQHIIGTDTSGKEINNGYGSQHLDKIKAVCKRHKKIGFAFDGDGDRVVAIDEKGKVVDGDKILYILASQRLSFGDKIVGTKITGLGLEISLRRLGVGLIREKVGTKYIVDRMKQDKIVLGGEACGHIFISQQGASDGVRIAIELLNILNRTGLSFEQLLSGYKEVYQIMKSVDIAGNENVVELEEVTNNMRVIVRKSETEPKIRIFIEGSEKAIVDKKCSEIIKGLS